MTEAQQAMLRGLGIGTADASVGTLADLVKAAVPAPLTGLGDGIKKIAEQLGLFRTVAQQQADTLAESTQSLLRSAATPSAGGTSYTAGSIAGAAARALGGGIGMSSLVSSLVGLFRGDTQEPEEALMTYIPPEAIRIDGAAPATPGMPIVPVDYGQDGLPRRFGTAQQPEVRSSWASASRAPVYAPAVTVQVQAMDSRSFLDHSSEIARAVREAILNADALGGAISEL